MVNFEGDLFLGFDLSTQQLKIIVTNEHLKHLQSFHVEFDKVYGDKYGVKSGVRRNEETGEIVSPVAMWLESIDYVFQQMKEAGVPLQNVRGISGSCQQHGSVYWSDKGTTELSQLNKESGSGGVDLEKGLAEHLSSSFSLETSPNWQDHSTGKELATFERVVGGAEDLASLTGSRAHYRFTGLQIRKIARAQPELYKKTDRISLVSSFVASVLLGEITDIEEADGCGMNLYDINTNSYSEELLSLAAGVHQGEDGSDPNTSKKGSDELRRKLGEIKPVTYKLSGSICKYFVEKYGFSPSTEIFSFTGDNLATILSLPLNQNDILVSLGTSTTVLLVTKNFVPLSQYHMFKHPTMPDHYMGMICYCNGSLAREKVRNELNEKYKQPKESWEKFDEILNANTQFDHKLGIYFPLGEIVPNAAAQVKRSTFDEEKKKLVDVDKWEIDEDVSCIVEGQTLSCRARLGPMLASEGSDDTEEFANIKKTIEDVISKFGEISTDGKKHTIETLSARPQKVYFVGGALKNTSIVTQMGSILGGQRGNARVDIPNSCALGGAFKASWGYACEQKGKWLDYDKYIGDSFDFSELEDIKVENKWENYFDGLGMLSLMEKELKTDE